uniref:DNA repair protein SWI5 homolog n=1 Tax=Timema genevievae TaxID=629358 RepID=A0A7R9K2S1_TIMGE|nr:unnamed protein product [Timema genevievae]
MLKVYYGARNDHRVLLPVHASLYAYVPTTLDGFMDEEGFWKTELSEKDKCETEQLKLRKQFELLKKQENKLDKEIENVVKQIYLMSSSEMVMVQLHMYNEVKDATQLVLGSLAKLENVTVRELHKQFDLCKHLEEEPLLVKSCESPLHITILDSPLTTP